MHLQILEDCSSHLKDNLITPSKCSIWSSTNLYQVFHGCNKPPLYIREVESLKKEAFSFGILLNERAGWGPASLNHTQCEHLRVAPCERGHFQTLFCSRREHVSQLSSSLLSGTLRGLRSCDEILIERNALFLYTQAEQIIPPSPILTSSRTLTASGLGHNRNCY